METELYKVPFTYILIYVMKIDDADHRGFLKVGQTTLPTTLGPTQLTPNCELLNKAAHERIKQYTQTALIGYELLYTELAYRFTVMEDGTRILSPFGDKKIHDVLARSGYICKRFPDSDDESEWYASDLETDINAIKAFKEGRERLTKAEMHCPPTGPEKEINTTIQLRDEQEEAVEQTLDAFKSEDTMLWDCKMRFGKTVATYELIKRGKYKKSIVVTHRPVVEEGWKIDHDKIFSGSSDHYFAQKEANPNNYEFDEEIDSLNNRLLNSYANNGDSFTYFISMQDLRGSKCAGGKYNKNSAVFKLDWDLIIYDEAHEGTQTDLGKKVQTLLEKPKNGKKPKVLYLSGTPYNLLTTYKGRKFTWDYVMEQMKKREYEEKYPDLHNPYADLPEMRILTFDLQKSFKTGYRFETADMAFNFREFFRTWTGNPEQDFYSLPKNAKIGDFVHEEDVLAFLNLITTDDKESKYPFSNPTFREMFKHTFWIVPGVKEARALSKLLQKHPIFKNYGIANVAGEGDEEQEYESALKTVQKTIKQYLYTITISCGRLTTGVTVPEWSAVMMLTGSANTAAAGYMQTIFRVQSAGSIDGKQKQVAYVFDFAPDRTLKVISEVNNIRKKGRTDESENRKALGEFLNFCPVISVSGTRMINYDVTKFMRQIRKISVDKAINSGFDDESIYNEDVGIVMNDKTIQLFNKLSKVVTGQSKTKVLKDVKINEQGLTKEQYQKLNKVKYKPKKERTKEEEELYQKAQELKKQRERIIRLLRSISIRLPLLIYGAKVDLNENIMLKDFVDLVDDESWAEFMPQNLDKELFKELLSCYNEDVIVGAGLRIRHIAKSADELPPTQRVKRITELFSRFRNPDKETVLTPWRIVNMHLGNTIGGYNFFGENYSPNSSLEEPRQVVKNEIPKELFLNSETKILEMNSKSGLYPLYLTYSFYAMNLPKAENKMSLEESQKIWQDVLRNNIFVLCKTPMAENITRRTLAGYEDEWAINTVYIPNLLTLMVNKEDLSVYLKKPSTWKKEYSELKFDAVVGNPPYQVIDGGGNGASSKPVYQLFVQQAKALKPHYISMIIPSRWFTGGKGLDSFRDEMLHDKRIRILHDYPIASDCFSGVQIKGGICYFLWDQYYNGNCSVYSHRGEQIDGPVNRPLLEPGCDSFIRYNEAITVLHKVLEKKEPSMEDLVSSRLPFGISNTYKGTKHKTFSDDLQIYVSGNNPEVKGSLAYIPSKLVARGRDLIQAHKVFIAKAGSGSDTFPHPILPRPFYGAPGTVCNESYLVIGPFPNKKICDNVISYISTKFFRFLVLQIKNTQNAPRNVYYYVPQQDFSKSWTDNELYEKYCITKDEIKFIDSMVKPMILDN